MECPEQRFQKTESTGKGAEIRKKRKKKESKSDG